MIESRIEEKDPNAEYQKALTNIIYTHNYLINEINACFKAHNVTRQQYNVLRILSNQHPKPSTINMIKEHMLDKMSDTSRIVERLRASGYVTKTQSNDDKRAAKIHISQKGLDLLKQTEPHVRGFTSLLKNLSSEEAQTFNELLDKIRS
jgi:DNA-binding MarR family transcriptional regulator